MIRNLHPLVKNLRPCLAKWTFFGPPWAPLDPFGHLSGAFGLARGCLLVAFGSFLGGPGSFFGGILVNFFIIFRWFTYLYVFFYIFFYRFHGMSGKV